MSGEPTSSVAGVADAWMQHPPGAMHDDPMFSSLRAWSHGRLARGGPPLEWTICAIDEAGVPLRRMPVPVPPPGAVGVFSDHLGIPWRYEHQGYDLGSEGPYLPDFLLYPNTRTAMWFEVKGRFPAPGRCARPRRWPRAPACPRTSTSPNSPPAPASLAEMTSYEELMDHEEEWIWLDEYGQARYPSGHAAWQIGLPPTAFFFSPHSERQPRSNHWWCVTRRLL